MAFKAMTVGVAVMVLLAMTAAVAMAGPVEYVVKWDFPTSDKYYSATQGRTYNVGDKLSKYSCFLILIFFTTHNHMNLLRKNHDDTVRMCKIFQNVILEKVTLKSIVGPLASHKN